MERSVQFNGLESIERLEEKLSPTSGSVSGIIDTSTILTTVTPDEDDPPPAPEPPLPPYPGDNPPIDYPLGPPSGPAGPG